MALTLAACGSADPQDVDYGGMSYSDLQSSAQNLVTSIAASSEEELSAAFETNEQYAKQYAKQYGREYRGRSCDQSFTVMAGHDI